ncbi:carbon-monoxide dehydrogenase medium subunit/2-furoyl-CoA dehydrogenase FAD binding subunit [Caldalkalibacillus uzonensis]|uniref:Carbon-monoxide dehydrogenase medium subunit/2-furoyl-CoA dehydrogenase FAD binding subunit n=1 Tax=Caldalkalibacillus uzonensis TaxID=353224 RepID=A0ABU0CXX9_9BACI|nr:xanthine dehydrogenase family protein subunit M [Caldalkalibacillus uzonensis]MDQ0341010.1 carbon-monoxide dehydrogenase medium subunit/2-furoyl-CoA dehydrogenase FAD binding subunit [Caldalkalibacillus uzonensis]
MKPAPFDYYRPSTLEETLQLLTEFEEEAKIIAGGQSFIPILNMRLSEPGVLVDINQLSDLEYITVEDGYLKIGALTRQRTLELSSLVQQHVPLLSEALPFIGHLQTRNRGTVGGSLVHADPSAEIPLALSVLNAEVVLRSTEEIRTVEIGDFFLTYLTANILPHELLTEIRIPSANILPGYAFVEFSRRHGDFAIVAVASQLAADQDGRIHSGRLALGGIDAVPVVADDAINILIGRQPTDELINQALELALEDADPDDDLHASREYRLQLARVLAKRALLTAYERALKRR